ncbi:ArnT family glycosyltransferase [Shewanella schlegeliana]|uniref:Glycosyltransferase family 39 protein n=1 Tax=Shewanella schlegeliana TaxID=190308 RepID=A0ABS1T1Y0_9GAMM|nr:glycosyltransferase family 39 protein [Shewanella schlegeliana]MBL4914679.1 glycosyltransferase family 39 protein [Shewanella schlegeliana]
MKSMQQRFNSDDYYQVLSMLLLFAVVILLVGIGWRSPWPADEPRFAEVAREMVDSGQWFFPQRGGEFYPDKPPVFMWAIALFYGLTGSLKVAFLLPNALAGLLTLFLVYDLGSRLWNVRVGRNAALLLMLAPQFLIQSKNAQIDAMVMCWITLGCYGLLRHFMTGPNWRWYFAGWAFMGLGVITKGVGFLPLLMLIPIIAYALIQKDLFKGRLQWWCLAGPLAMLAVIACWLVPMVLIVQGQGTPELLQYQNNILFKQTGERYVNAWHHIKPWYYFLVSVVPVMWFPLPLLFIAHWQRFVAKVKADPVIAILLIWVVLVLVFFSISPGKRGVYILPALPMLALALSAIITGADTKRWFEWGLTALLWILGLVFTTAGVLALIHHPAIVKAMADYAADLTHIGYLLLTVGIIWFVILVALRHSQAMVRMGISLAMTWMVIGTWGYTILEPMRTPQVLMANVAEAIGPDGQLGLVKFKEQFILFSPVDITHFSYLAPLEQQERNAWQWMHEGDERYILVGDHQKLSCFDFSGAKSMGVAHRDNWVLLSKDNMLPTCAEPDRRYQYFTPTPGRWME